MPLGVALVVLGVALVVLEVVLGTFQGLYVAHPDSDMLSMI